MTVSTTYQTSLTSNYYTFYLEDLPIPPTSNSQYKLFRRGLKTYHVPSAELKRFKKDMEAWALKNHKRCIDIKNAIHGRSHIPLSCECIFYFKKERIWTKAGKPKKFDVSNRLKAIHDEVCKLIGIDDSEFFSISAKKIPTEGFPECVNINIRLEPYTMTITS